MHTFRIYRYDADVDVRPRMQVFETEVGDGERMLLDALIKLKTIDPSLSFRPSPSQMAPISERCFCSSPAPDKIRVP